MTGAAMVLTTVGTLAEGRTMARELVEKRLAACVQIIPLSSVYRWNETVEEAAEHLLLCKIAKLDFAEVRAAIRARHAYAVPEIVMTDIVAGDQAYLSWLNASVQRKDDQKSETAARRAAVEFESK